MGTPRGSLVPGYESTLGVGAIELAASAGLVLDEWQSFVLKHALGRRDGRWAAFEVGVNVARQNGKDGLLEARELAGLFLIKERLQIFSAHQFDTSLEGFLRLEALIDGSDELRRQVKRVTRSHGEEGITLLDGCRIRYRTRTKGGGRGFSCDCLYLNESMDLALMAHGALLPTLSARPDPQVWYTGSAVDQFVHENGIVFSRVRERGIKGDKGLAYFEWSADASNPDALQDETAADPVSCRRANHALGIRISSDHIDLERRSMDPRTFAVERLGVGDWPPTAHNPSVIDLAKWGALVDADSKIEGPLVLALDVRPDRSAASICAAGDRSDGIPHLELIERRPGTSWVVPRLVQLRANHRIVAVACDSASPAGSLVPEIQENGIEVTLLTAKELSQSCGLIFDAVEDEALRHLGQSELLASLRGAVKRPLGDSWAWDRKNSAIDISPLVAATVALWANSTMKVPAPFAGSWA